MRKRDIAKKLSFAIKMGIRYYSIFSKQSLQRKFNRMKYQTGYRGLYRRYCIVKNLAISCGDDVAIFDNVTMNCIEKMEIGNNVAFNTGVYIEAYGGMKIGNDVSLAQGVSIHTTNHIFSSVDVPHNEQGLNEGKVEIGNDVWIGCKATVLMGVSIPDGCVIGAGAVVPRDLPPYSVSVGVPAKVIKYRK